jgi:hypothetical protein
MNVQLAMRVGGAAGILLMAALLVAPGYARAEDTGAADSAGIASARPQFVSDADDAKQAIKKGAADTKRAAKAAPGQIKKEAKAAPGEAKKGYQKTKQDLTKKKSTKETMKATPTG